MLETTGPFHQGRAQLSTSLLANGAGVVLSMYPPHCRGPSPRRCNNRYALLEHDEFTRSRFQSIRRFAPISPRHDESDVAHRFAVVQPHALELIDRHRAVAPG